MDIIAWANNNKEIVCTLFFICLGGLGLIAWAITRDKKKRGSMEESEEEEEDDDYEPEKQCTFQCNWDDDEKAWICDMTDGNTYCDKTKCPFWNKGE